MDVVIKIVSSLLSLHLTAGYNAYRCWFSLKQRDVTFQGQAFPLLSEKTHSRSIRRPLSQQWCKQPTDITTTAAGSKCSPHWKYHRLNDATAGANAKFTASAVLLILARPHL